MTRKNGDLNHEKQSEVNLHNNKKKSESIVNANLQLSKSRQNIKGITLIALVITVIILLILARSNNRNGNIWNGVIQ